MSLRKVYNDTFASHHEVWEVKVRLSVTDTSDCQTDRLAALEQERDNPDAGIYVPICTPDNKVELNLIFIRYLCKMVYR